MEMKLRAKLRGAAVVLLVVVGAGLCATAVAAAEPAAPDQEPAWFTKIKEQYTRQYKNPGEAPPLPTVSPAPRWPAREYGYRQNKFPWSGFGLVCDPVNKEALFLCGHNGGMPFGTMGSWALAEDGKTWREMKFTSTALDPLRQKALAARKPAKDGEAAARNVFYAALDAAREAKAIKADPAKLTGEAVKLAEEFSAALAGAKADGWEKEAVERAKPLAEKALAGLKSAKAALEGGKVDATVLESCFDAQWALDEAAAALACSPGSREGARGVYDPQNKCVVLFGGSHHDYMSSETWIYDCAGKSWRQAWSKTAPSPRMNADIKFDEGKKTVALSGGRTVLNKMVAQQGFMAAPAGEWTFDAKSGEWNGDAGAPGGSRIYRTIVPAYDPRCYDAAPRGDPKATADWLDGLKPNTWTIVPMQPAPAPERDWGTAVLDPDRDQIYRWSGGHCADPSTIVSTYHPGINRWSIPFVAEIYGKGMSFNGRPDCLNHTYLHYAYDPLSKRLICASMGGTGVYNPDIRDFEFSVDQPFNCHIYETCTVGTPKGVVLWGQGGQMWLFDYPGKAWKKFPVVGRAPAPLTDFGAIAYDSKRDAIWMVAPTRERKPSGNIWRLDMKTGQIQAMNPANSENIGKRFNGALMRESAYLPTVDLMLFNNFVGSRQAAYDPEKNRWVLLNINRDIDIKGTGLGGYGLSLGMRYDAKRDLVWGLSSWKKIFVIRIDSKTLEVSE